MAAMTSLVLLLWAGVTAASQVDLHKRIYGGRDCFPNERPHHVALISTKTIHPLIHESRCGGTLISDRWVLTAAHCYKDEKGWKMKATIGTLRNPIRELVIKDTPKFFPDNGIKHDIMLVKLPKSVPSSVVPHAVLPTDCSQHPKIGENVTVAGYARTNSRPGDKKVTLDLDLKLPLQCGDFKVTRTCGSCIVNSTFVYPETFCYQETLKDTVRGDSGGGVMYNGTLYGVHVASGEKLCETSAIAVKVCMRIYLDWIDDTINTPSLGCFGSWCSG